MDAIWLCVTTLLLHVLINRLFGRLHGWSRLAHWPVMHLTAMAAHALLITPAIFWLLQWSAPLTGLSAANCDALISIAAAVAAAFVLRHKRRARLAPPP
jgi:hypothetical protein